MKHFICLFQPDDRIDRVSRSVFFAKEKPSSAPPEKVETTEETEKVPSLKHMAEEVDRFETKIQGQLKSMENFYNAGTPEELKITIDSTEFNEELAAKYRKAGMGEKAIKAVQALVEGLATMKQALKNEYDSRALVLTELSSAVKFVNDTMKGLSANDLYGSKMSDPLNAEMTPVTMEELKLTEEEKETQEEGEEAPEAQEASLDDRVTTSIEGVANDQDHLVDAEALLKKAGGTAFEVKGEDYPAAKGLIRAVVTPSADGKAVRVEWWTKGGEEHQGVEQIRQEHVYYLDTEDKGTEEFGSQTEAKEEEEALNTNREKFLKDIEWLKGEAPVGSRVTIDENRYVLKDADGELYVVTTKDGKEVGQREPYKEQEIKEVDNEPLELTKGVQMTDITPEQREAAVKFYEAGSEAYKAGHFDTAMEQFKKSYEVAASPNTHQAMVQVLVDQGLYEQAYVEAQATMQEYEALLPKMPNYQEAYGYMKEKLAIIETRLSTGTASLVRADQEPERKEATPEVQKEVALKRVKKLARNLIELSSAPRTEGSDKMIRDWAQEIGKIAKANNLDAKLLTGTGTTGEKHYVRIAENKVDWGKVEKSKKGEEKTQYVAQGEIKIEAPMA